MLKIAGILLIIVCCALIGAWLAGNLRRRAQSLKKTQLFLHMLCERLNYTLSPVQEIFDRLEQEAMLAGLDFIPACAVSLRGGAPFDEAFAAGVERSACALDKEDRRILCQAAGIIGGSAVENQLEGLALVKAGIAAQAAAAQENVEKRARLYASLGILSGVAVAIILV